MEKKSRIYCYMKTLQVRISSDHLFIVGGFSYFYNTRLITFLWTKVELLAYAGIKIGGQRGQTRFIRHFLTFSNSPLNKDP